MHLTPPPPRKPAGGIAGSVVDRAARMLGGTLGRLAQDRSANALIEFAYSLPIFLTLGMYGTELAYMANVNMQVSQVAMALADNASRLGQADNSAVSPTINNTDIDSVMAGAMRQGEAIDFQTNGRVILSSLEMNSNSRQYIHWQKCRGNLAQTSAYGGVNYGATGTAIAGLGKSDRVIAATSGYAVMFVEAFYSYKPLFGNMFVKNVKFSHEAAFMNRDRRNLSDGVTGATGSSECT